MRDTSFRLHFKHSQPNTQKPTFSLRVSAEMTLEFMKAAKKYGYLNELVYADPKLEEARQLRRQKAEEARAQDAQIQQAFDRHGIGEFALGFKSYNPIVWVITLPFRMIWWIFAGWHVQKHQIIRFHELKDGKTITANNVIEILEAEKTVQQTAEAIASVVVASVNYGSEQLEARSAA